MHMGVAELALIAVAFLFISRRRWGSGWSSGGITSGLSNAVRDLQVQVDAAHAELESQRQQVSELAERLDFTERRLLQIRDGRISSPVPPSEPTPPPAHS